MLLCFLDFEANCSEDHSVFNEIIEFPMLLTTSDTVQTVGVFHQYVKPISFPALTPFCTELTGITQDKVEHAKPLVAVLSEANEWLREKSQGQEVLFITCGNWDLRKALPNDCQSKGIPLPPVFKNFKNLKDIFREKRGRQGGPLGAMLDALRLTFKGRPHSGIDDTRNIARIYRALVGLNPDLD